MESFWKWPYCQRYRSDGCYFYLSRVIDVNTTNKTEIYLIMTAYAGIYLAYLI